MADETARKTLQVDVSQRTLAVWVRQMCDVSHSQAKQLVLSGVVSVDGSAITDPVYRPDTGQTIQVGDRPTSGKARVLSGPGFRVVHIDRELLVVDKASGVVTIPTSNPRPDDIPLVASVGATLQVAGHRGERLWVVHRIDRETSGLVVLARGERSYNRLKSQFRQREPQREYLAWTQGIPAPSSGTLVHFLAEEPDSTRMTTVKSAGAGDRAELSYAIEATSGDAARVRVTLRTGRRNQIRVQFADSGWPLIGDRYYGAQRMDIDRTALHAANLSFVHPRSGRRVSFQAPLPADLGRLDRSFSSD